MANEPLGFIGLGIMGSRMAANLARAGYDVRVCNRTRETADAWAEEHGGTVAGSPREAAERATAVISMVVDGPQVEQMLLGEDGAAHGAATGTLLVDMSTIAPADARRIGAALDRARPALRRRARDGLVAQGRGRHAHDHGRRRRRRTWSARGPASRSWAR